MTCQTDDPEREAAHLAFVRDIEPKLKPLQNEIRSRYLDSPHRAGLPEGPLPRLRPRPGEPPGAVPRGEHPPRDRAGRARAAVPEDHRRHDRDLPGAGADPRADGPLPRGDRPLAPPGGLGARRQPTPGRPRGARRPLRPDGPAPGRGRARGGLRRTTSTTPTGPASGSTTGSPTRSSSRTRSSAWSSRWPASSRRRAGRRSGSRRSGPGTWRSTPRGRPPLRPFDDVETLAEGTEAIFAGVDPELGQQFAYLREHGLLDLANRKGKAPGGYQTTLEDDRLPFIFMNAVGLDGDVRTLLHEGGHAFHALASRGEPLAAYRESPIEFCEVASMAMELLGAREPRAVLRPTRTPTARIASSSRGSS